MAEVRAFHTLWTKPKILRGKQSYEILEDYEIFSIALSALFWQKCNGPIRLYTDQIGVDFINRTELAWLWNAGIDTDFLSQQHELIDPITYWAGAKLLALEHERCPIVMMDIDFITWKNITEFLLKDTVFKVVHREELDSRIYPSKEIMPKPDGFKFTEDDQWLSLPCNTAFAYFADDVFKEKFTCAAIGYMNKTNGIRLDEQCISLMVFVEQRLLSMCAVREKIEIESFYDLDFDTLRKQQLFTHIWGFKDILRSSIILKQKFCALCAKRIRVEFPAAESKLKKIKAISRYFYGIA